MSDLEQPRNTPSSPVTVAMLDDTLSYLRMESADRIEALRASVEETIARVVSALAEQVNAAFADPERRGVNFNVRGPIRISKEIVRDENGRITEVIERPEYQ